MVKILVSTGAILWSLILGGGQVAEPSTSSPPISSPNEAVVFDVTAIIDAQDASAVDDHVAKVNASGAFARRSGNALLIHGNASVRQRSRAVLEAIAAETSVEVAAPSPIYTTKPRSGDGIGKAIFGREISQVMGHLGAEWLERPQREQEERTDLLAGMLPISPDTIIADIGAGSGYFTSRLAPRVPKGGIIATDIQPEMLTMLKERVAKEGLTNVKTVLGSVDKTGLDEGSVDLILLVDVYHEFDHPWEMLQSMRRSLKDGGLVGVVEYRANDPTVPIKPLHTMTSEQVQLEFELAGYVLKSIQTDLPRQRLFLFAGE